MKKAEVLKTTVNIKLRPPNFTKREWLETQTTKCLDAINKCLPVALTMETLDKSNVTKLLYPIARDTGLSYYYAEALVGYVAGQVKSYTTNVELDPSHQPPTFKKLDFIPFRGPAWKIIQKGDNFVMQLSLTGNQDYHYFPLELPSEPHSTGLDVRTWLVALTKERKANKKKNPDAKLEFRNGNWFLSLPVEHKLTAPKKPANVGQVFPVDMGLVNHVCMVTKDKVVFLNGKKDHADKEWLSQVRRRYQLHNRTDLVKAARGSEARWIRWVNHKLSRIIVDEAIKRGCTAIALEQLDGIRDKNRGRFMNRRIHGWSFFGLRGQIEYKAKIAGLAIIDVKPEFTSQKCPKCGHTEKRNRATRGQFCCLSCGFKAHADYVAQLNIGEAAYHLTESSVVGTNAATTTKTLNEVA
jgi:putative transposase